jgi:hypothetical protein
MKSKHVKELLGGLRNGDHEQTEEGLLVRSSAVLRGKYTHLVNGGDLQTDYNLLTIESIAYVLNVAFGDNIVISNFYLALYSGNATPQDTWTAANWSGSATEIVNDTTQGYTGANRPLWTPGAAGAIAGGVIGSAARSVYNIVETGSPVIIYGATLCSIQARGDATGTLGSATRFGTARSLNNSDVFELGYEIELTDS